MVGEKGEKLANLDLNFKLDNFFYKSSYFYTFEESRDFQCSFMNN